MEGEKEGYKEEEQLNDRGMKRRGLPFRYFSNNLIYFKSLLHIKPNDYHLEFHAEVMRRKVQRERERGELSPADVKLEDGNSIE